MNTVPSLPPGFSSSTVVYAGTGVTATMGAWGSAMQVWYNTTRLPDLQTSKLGVYTDNGGFYNNVANFGNQTAPEIFGPMFAGFKAEGIPVAYLMLDDWWYQEVSPGSMLIDTPVANPRYFPQDLSGLWEAIGVPLDIYSVHYTSNFTLFLADNISIIHDNWAPPRGLASRDSERLYTVLRCPL